MSQPIFEMYVFDVGLGQSIFFRPIGYEHYNLMIDIGNTPDKNPIDFIVSQGILPVDSEGYYYISDLALSNYDHDHYSGLSYLITKVKIKGVTMIKSISPEQLDENKPEKTEALGHLVNMKKTYIHPIQNRSPPYNKWTSYLYPTDKWDGSFNDLSQIIFVEYMGFTICIPGDLEQEGRNLMLVNPEVVAKLKKTQVFFASHHGRENGYMKEIFDHCTPNVIIISDKEIVHTTQEKSSDVYGKHVIGDGLIFDGQEQFRKVISTRNDGSFVFKGFNDLKYSIHKIDF